jgi:hypothetical protein
MFWHILEGMRDLTGITQRFAAVRGVLDERSRRLVAAAESAAIGRGGVSAVARATGLSRQVIRQGMAELSQAGAGPPGRIRRPGGGRKKAVAKDPSLLRDLERLVEPVTRGDPESPLRWTCKSLRKLAAELRRLGHQTSHQLVGRMPSGPQRPVRVSQPQGETPAAAASTGHFRGHQEEGVGGRFQE